MGDPVKVWAVSQGSYSDYSVKALFPTKKLAEAARVAHAAEEEWDEGRVEWFYLYDEVPEPVTAYYMTETLWDNGDTSDMYERAETRLPWNHWNAPPANGRPQVWFVRAPVHENKGGRLDVKGYDLQAVRQAFGDRKGMERAKRMGLT
jgi:hypothetical protein